MVNGSNTSGFGYDSEKHCVTAEDPVWEAYLQVHKEATRWKHKSFPYYEDLCIVFGKDRAQGNRARDFIEMEQDVNLEEEMQESDDDILESEEISHNTSVQNDETSPSVRSNKRKRRADDVFHNAHYFSFINMKAFVNLKGLGGNIWEVFEVLDDARRAIFRDTVFGYFIDVPRLQGDALLFHKMFLHQIRPDPVLAPDGIKRLYFRVGNTKMVYGPEEFCLITGFNFGEYPKNIGRKGSEK
uniref:Uncharacterized protein n=1 Tax=Lactuca sativa TaxID=4236 RepID=A0A9R1WPU8_LACSA|nr:hypothetical protein LSAT_V11C100012970 [Lactuca sativa]